MVIKQGMIYRSADLSRLTKQDILTFSTLGIQTICDLRTSSERKSHPPKIMEHDKIVHIPMQPDSMMPSKWTMFRMLIAEGKSLSFTPIMKDVYQSMLYERKKRFSNCLLYCQMKKLSAYASLYKRKGPYRLFICSYSISSGCAGAYRFK
ncbi:tyrosine-protein phosphatase [Bacillus sp. B6(2022)]|nr:tyrosine-protein phosphatase [Bacillus sp. B6(2022)]